MATTPKKVTKPAVKATIKTTVKPAAVKAKVAKTVAAVKAKAKTVKAGKTSTTTLKKVTAASRKNVSAAVNMTRDASFKLIDSQRAVWLAGLGALAKASAATGTQGARCWTRI